MLKICINYGVHSTAKPGQINWLSDDEDLYILDYINKLGF